MRSYLWAWMMVVVGVGHPSSAFNFLPLHPQVFRGSSGAQFGYSVALWDDETNTKRVVVGAPRDNQTAWWGENLPLGNTYYCVPDAGSGTDDGCVAPFNLSLPEEDQNVKRIYNTILRTQGVGFGRTVETERDGNKALTCATLYPNDNTKEEAKTRSLCYVMTNLTDKTEPLVLPNNNAFDNSLIGFSATLVRENGEESLIMGGPNALNECGLLYNHAITKGTRTSMLRMRVNRHCGTTYEGWAISVGRFGGAEAKLTLATSAPKYNYYSGQVMFYNLHLKKARPLHTIAEDESDVGGMFGYAIIGTDVDGDQATDLLVGAPLSSGRTSKHMDAGKVFVYYAPLDKTSQETRRQVIGGDQPWGRFGMALADLGDVDRDGYNDVAVGAPYGGPDGAGAVYVYNGGQHGLRIDKPKVIAASEFLPGMRGFGFSLAGGLDMDGNGYTDLVVGSLSSDAAVLLRSSPVVKLKGNVYFFPKTIVVEDTDNCRVDIPGQRSMRAICVNLFVNFTYSSYGEMSKINAIFKMNLLGEDTGPASYGFLKNNAKTDLMARTIDKDVSLPWSLSVYIQRSRANINLTLNAAISVSIEPSPPPTTSTAPPMPPVLDVFTPSTYHTSATLRCNDESTCFTKPDLALSVYGPPVVIGASSKIAQVNVTLEVKDDPAYGIKIFVRHPTLLTFHSVAGDGLLPECRRVQFKEGNITCQIEEVNAEEEVKFALNFQYDASEVFSVPSLYFTMFVRNDVDSDTNKDNNRASVTIPVQKKATLYPSGFSNPEATTVTVNQTAKEKELKQVEESPDATFRVNKLGPRFEHSFSLSNRGPSQVEGAQLLFQVPLFLGEQRLTYFMEQPKYSPQVTCSPVPINPLGLQPPEIPPYGYDASSTTIITATDSSVTHKITSRAELLIHREERDTKETTLSLTTDPYSLSSSSPYSLSSSSPSSLSSSSPSSLSSLSSESSTFPSSFQWTTDPADFFSTTYDPITSQTTDDGNALECRKPECLVVCNVSRLQPDESINVTFSSYLVTATVDQLGFRKMRMRTWVTCEVAQSGSTIINPTLPATTEIFLIKPPELGFSALPLWALILAIVIAILLILVIILVLRKAGFFKRKRPPVPPKRESVLVASNRESVHVQNCQDEKF